MLSVLFACIDLFIKKINCLDNLIYCTTVFKFLYLRFGLLLMNGINYLLKMAFPCRGKNCKKSFSTKSSRNKHKNIKNHGPQFKEKTKIPCVDNLYHFRTNGCDVESKYNVVKHNVVKHLKMFVKLEKKKTVANIKVYPVYLKIFPQKSNRSRHVKNFHHDLENSIVIDNQHDEDTQNETKPLVVLAIDTCYRLRKWMYCHKMSKWKIC